MNKNTKVTSISFAPGVKENIDRCIEVFDLYPAKRSTFINYIMKEVTNTMLDTVPRLSGTGTIFDMNIILSFEEKGEE